MEKAIFTNRPEKYDLAEYDRVYFGNEFCERRILSPAEVRKIISYCTEKNKRFTFVTPYCTDFGIEKIRKILRILPLGTEVVFNDFGLLEYLHDFEPVFGRVLNKQKRGPEIVLLKKHLPWRGYKYFQSCNIDAMQDFLLANKVQRAEICNVIQEFKIKSKLKLSLYYPYVYVSTTRLCMLNGVEDLIRKKLEIKPCCRECDKYLFHNEKFPLNLVLKGNTQFYFNDKIPRKGYDRLVYMPEIIV